MISKHISCKPENDNYRRLAQYIADANHEGEKCLLSWCAGCEGSDNNYQSAIQEVLDIQDINTRSKREKTYHLVVSLRTEDEGKLSEQNYQDIELEFAKALGFQAHQRHCGVHKNTDNLHMHIAYNMINPETYRRHEPFRDYYALEKTCRTMEQKYNLSIDNGITKDERYKLSNNSAGKESRTGEESFERYVINRHDKIMQELENVSSWQSMHRVFAKYGLELTQRGNGLSIKNMRGNQRLKASKFNKELSYKKLVEKFGNFQSMKSSVQAKDRYRRTPLQKNAIESKLWIEFIEDTKQMEIYEIKEKWKKEKIKITGLTVTRQKQHELLKLAKVKEQQEIIELRKNFSVKTLNWLSYLQVRAVNGDEKALEVLRSKKDLDRNEEIKIKNNDNYSEKLIERENYLKKQNEILSNSKTSLQSKKKLLAVEIMRKVAGRFSYKVDTSGNIIFSFENGGKIIDSGHKISFSDNIRVYGLLYAQLRYGIDSKNKDKFKSNQITLQSVIELRKQEEKQEKKQEQSIQNNIGWSR